MIKQYLKADYYWLGWLVLTTLLYWYVQDHWRPTYTGGELGRYLLGVAPNYLPGLGLPGGLYLILEGIHKEGDWITRLKKYGLHWIGLGIAMTGLIAWEFAQLLFKGGYFDPHDVLWTLLGGATFVLIWWLTPKRYAVIPPNA